MIPPKDLVAAFFKTFDMSALEDFKKFLNRHPQVGKWFISADYCLGVRGRPNNVFAFTLIPYNQYFQEIKVGIHQKIPNDIKHTREINEAIANCLLDENYFHFAFVIPSSLNLFNNGDNSDYLDNARDSLEISLKEMILLERSNDNLRGIKKLVQKSKAKSFDVRLLNNFFLLSYIFCFLTMLLVREGRSTQIGWFSDRDSMTNWCDGAIWSISIQNLKGLSEHFGIQALEHIPAICIPAPDSNDMWFDEVIRLPDYIAGILSVWNFETNELSEEGLKYQQLRNIIATAKNMVVLKLVCNDFMQCSRISFSITSDEDKQ